MGSTAGPAPSSGARGGGLASDLILDAELAIAEAGYNCGPDGLLTYVKDASVASPNPGYCFKCAGYVVAGRSADDKKTLLRKSYHRPMAAAISRAQFADQVIEVAA